MKNLFKYILLSILLSPLQVLQAQDCNISISAIVDPGFAKVTSETASALQTQLERLITQAKMDAERSNANFAVTAKFDQLDRHIVGGAPVQIVNMFGVTLYLVDLDNQKFLKSVYVEVKGVGGNDTKASMDAVRQLNAGNRKINMFFSSAKQEIINYYDAQMASILKDARIKASMKKYDEALGMLIVVPTCCNGYDAAMKEALDIYAQYRDVYFSHELNKAKALWAGNPTQEGGIPVVAILSSIDPEAKCYLEAMSLLSQVARVVKSDVDFESKIKYRDGIELEKLRVQAIGEIGKAYAANHPRTNIAFLGQGAVVGVQ